MGKILVTRSSMPTLEEYIHEIEDIWESRWLTNMGNKHQYFEKALMDFLNVPNISLFCNGHMALELTIQAMEVPLGSEIITTPFTFASTTHAIVRNGCVPVFCDIREDNYTIDADKIEKLITEKTVAILPVHVYGNICDVEKIENIAEKYGLKVVYDAAHAFGVKYKGKTIGNWGDASIFSFHATKVFHSIEGGGVAFKEEKLRKRLCRLKNFGIVDEEHVDSVGANGKMNEFAAAMGICNLRHINEEIAKRKNVFEYYIEKLQGVDGIKIPEQNEDIVSNYAYFPIVVKDEYGKTRDELYRILEENDIVARKYFYPCINEYECYKTTFNKIETPVAHDISYRVMTLPMYAELTREDVDKICGILIESRN